MPGNGQDWDWPFTNFVKVLPEGNRRVLLERKRASAPVAPTDSLEVTRG